MNSLLFAYSWRNNKKAKCPTGKWSGIQNVLEEAESDILILLDCCASGIASTNSGSQVNELIAACAYNSSRHVHGMYRCELGGQSVFNRELPRA